MDLYDNLFIFLKPKRSNKINNSQLKLNIHATVYDLYYGNGHTTVDCSVLRNHSSTMVMLNKFYPDKEDDLFVVYNWKELSEIFNTTNSDLVTKTQQESFMQIDRVDDIVFTKVFLPYNQTCLASDTHDFSQNLYVTTDFIKPLDWQYHTTFSVIDLKVVEDRLVGELEICKGILNEDMYINYAGQSIPAKDGVIQINFKYVPNNDIYLGSELAQYNGRKFEVDKCIHS